MFVKDCNTYYFDCGQNIYKLHLNDREYTITGKIALYYTNYAQTEYYSSFYLNTVSHCSYMLYEGTLEQLATRFNQQILDSYDVGGSKYIESEKIIENQT